MGQIIKRVRGLVFRACGSIVIVCARALAHPDIFCLVSTADWARRSGRPDRIESSLYRDCTKFTTLKHQLTRPTVRHSTHDFIYTQKDNHKRTFTLLIRFLNVLHIFLQFFSTNKSIYSGSGFESLRVDPISFKSITWNPTSFTCRNVCGWEEDV